MTASLRHVALRTLTDVRALSVAAEVRAWGVLTLVDVLTQPGVVCVDDEALIALTGVADGLVDAAVGTHLGVGPKALVDVCG